MSVFFERIDYNYDKAFADNVDEYVKMYHEQNYLPDNINFDALDLNQLYQEVFNMVQMYPKDYEYLTLFAILMLKGIGCSADEKTGLETLAKCARKGNPLACFELGNFYYALKDSSTSALFRALSYYNKSANKGFAPACVFLGDYYCLSGDIQDTKKAFILYQKGAKQQYVEANYQLACCFEEGKGCAVNYENAFINYHIAANGGHTDAQRRIAIAYLNGEPPYVEKDEKTAVIWLVLLANKDDAEGSYLYAECAAFGKGMEIDYAISLQQLQKSVLSNHSKALILLAQLFLEGKGVTKNDKMAISYLKKAYAIPDYDAAYQLGLYYYNQCDYSQALIYIDTAAANGHLQASLLLATCYIEKQGKTQDYGEAVRLLETCADKLPRAAFLLGILCLEGIHVKKDLEKALTLLQKASTEGYALASYYLYQCYLKGDVIRKNTSRAKQYLVLSAMQGHTIAQYQVALHYYQENEEEGLFEHDYHQAFYWFYQATSTPCPDEYLNEIPINELADAISNSYYYLALCYEKGNGVEPDYKKELNCLLAAANNGLVMAQLAVAKLYLAGNYGVNPNKELAAFWLEQAAKQNDREAQLLFADCCFNGIGVLQDYLCAFLWYEQCAQNVLPQQSSFKGKIKRQKNRVQEEQEEFEIKRQKQFLGEAQYKLGYCYKMELGTAQDYSLAAFWFEKSSEMENQNGVFEYACCLFDGLGITQNQEKAVRFLEHLFNTANHPDAAYLLGCCYYDGKGTRQDYAKAKECWLCAAGEGHQEAKQKLKDLFNV